MAQWIELRDGTIVNLDKMNKICIKADGCIDTYTDYSIRIYGDEDNLWYEVTENESREAAIKNMARIAREISSGHTMIYYNYLKG